MAAQVVVDPNKPKKKRLDQTVLGPDGKPVDGGVGQTQSLADANGAAPAANPLDAAAQGASPDAAKMAGAKVAPTSRSLSAPSGTAAQAPQSTPDPPPSSPSATQPPPKPARGATPSPADRVAAASEAQSAAMGGAPTDLAAAMRYQSAAAPQLSAADAEAAGRAGAAANATKGLGGLDALLQKRFAGGLDSALSAGGQIGSTSDVALAPGETYSASDFLSGPGSSGEALAGAAQSALEQQANYRLADADLNELGYPAGSAARAALARALGKDPVGATAKELREALSGLSMAMRQDGEAATSAANDTRLGTNARESAQEVADSAERATGAAAQEIDQTMEEVERGDSLSFKGTEVPVEELLKSGEASDWIKAYADAAIPDDRKRLAAEEPELAAWVDDHLGAISASIAADKESAEAKANEYNTKAKIWQSAKDLGLSGAAQDDLRKAAESGAPVAVAILDPTKALDAGFADPTALGGQLRALAGSHPGLYQALLHGDYGQPQELVSRLGLGSADPKDAAKWSSFVRHAQELKGVEGLVVESQAGQPISPDQAVAALFPSGATLADVQAAIQAEKRAGTSTPTGQILAQAFDPDGNGFIESAQPVSKAQLEALRVALSGRQNQLKDPAGLAKGAQQAVSSADSPLADALKDHKFDPSDGLAVAQAISGGNSLFPTTSASSMYQALQKFGVADQAMQDPKVMDTMRRAAHEDTATVLQAVTGANQQDLYRAIRDQDSGQFASVLGADGVWTAIHRLDTFLGGSERANLDPVTLEYFQTTRDLLSKAAVLAQPH